MRFTLILLFLFLLVPFFGAEAHQLKSDGAFTILQHSDPNDMPVAGTSTLLYLIFSKEPENFSVDDCDCALYIAPYSELENIKEDGARFVYGEEVKHTVGPDYELPYIFPKKDVYAILIEGSPKDGATFEPFSILFSLRVDREISPPPVEIAPSSTSPILLYTSALIALAALIGILLYTKRSIKK